MRFAVIAAGEGSRLAAEGIAEPKPLVRVGGEALIDRLLRVFVANGASEIDVIVRSRANRVAPHLDGLVREGFLGHAKLRYMEKTPPSSMHSFYELSRWFDDEPFVLTTVDTVFREDEFALYVKRFEQAVASGLDGLMGVTRFVDDESPLYVSTDARTGLIDGFFDVSDERAKRAPFVSGGIYGLTYPALATLQRCIDGGQSRMRNFQRQLIEDGLRLAPFEFSKVLDVDHASDIGKAEALCSGSRSAGGGFERI